LPTDTHSIEARAWAGTQPPRQWRLVSWRNGANPPWRARFCAVRVTPTHDWRAERRLAPEVWLLAERDLGPTPRTKYYLVDLPPTASLRTLVRLAHQRWAIEQQYQELKDEIGLDHFEGRSLLSPGVCCTSASAFHSSEMVWSGASESRCQPAIRLEQRLRLRMQRCPNGHIRP
jgi:hypothetical protein